MIKRAIVIALLIAGSLLLLYFLAMHEDALLGVPAQITRRWSPRPGKPADEAAMLHEPRIRVERARVRIVDGLNSARMARVEAEVQLDAALAQQEAAFRRGVSAEIARANERVVRVAKLADEARDCERVAHAEAEAAMARIFKPSGEWTDPTLDAAERLIADLDVRRAELEKSVARRDAANIAHVERIAQIDDDRTTFVLGTVRVPSPSSGPRYSVVVDRIEPKNAAEKLPNANFANALQVALAESGRFVVVAQNDVELRALKAQLRGMTAAGRIAPAQLVVRAVITDVNQGGSGGGMSIGGSRRRTKVHAIVQMFDAATGSVVAAKSVIGESDQREADAVQRALGDAVDEAATWLAAQLPSVPWRGSAIRVAGGRVIINRGIREGITVGDELIAGESEILRDPDTGEVLEELIRERARLRVVSVTERTAVCEIVTGKAREIVAGMTVQYIGGTP